MKQKNVIPKIRFSKKQGRLKEKNKKNTPRITKKNNMLKKIASSRITETTILCRDALVFVFSTYAFKGCPPAKTIGVR